MSYDSAIFYLDYALGNDAARTALTNCEAANPSGTITRITKAGHGLITGAVVDLTSFTAWLNSAWKITKVDDDNFDLDGAVWQAAADHTGTVTPRGGSGWGTDAWATMKTGSTAARIQAGDIVKIAESPHPVSVGNAKWTQGPIPSNINIVTASADTPIAVHIHTHGLSTGDVVQIYGCTGNVGANGVFKVTYVGADDFTLDNSVGTGAGTNGTVIKANSKAVVLATADQTKEIDDCDLTYTLANSGVVGVYVNQKQGLTSCKIGAPTSGSATGTKYAYKEIPEINLSAYQKISLWVISSSASMLATWWKICLCSDTAGANIVDEFFIPAMAYAGWWQPVTITRNGGGDCGNSIKSIAFYSNTVAPTNSTYMYVDNIIACKTDGLTLTSLISKNSSTQGGTEAWYGIQSIQRDIVLLDQEASATVSYGTGYFGSSSASAATYIREPIRCNFVSFEGPTRAGYFVRPIQYQGGYNTSTGEQSGETILDMLNSMIYLYLNYWDITVNHVSVTRGQYGIYLTGRRVKALNCFSSNCYYSGFLLSSAKDCTVLFTFATNSREYGINVSNCYDDSNIVRDGKTLGNATAGVADNGFGAKLVNVTISETAKVNATAGYSSTFETRVTSHREGNVDDVHYTYFQYGLISSDAVNRHTGSGLAWSMAVTNAARTEQYPLYLRVARVICEADVEVSVSAYVKLSSSTDIAARLICPGGQIKGVDLNVIDNKTANEDWEKLTVTFEPTEFGIVDIYILAWWVAGTADEKVYVDDVSWTVE